MNCDDVQNGIYVFLDGEFAAPEEADFQDHIDQCDTCRALVVREARFLNMVRDHVQEPELPLGLETRVRASLEAAGAPGSGDDTLARRFRSWWRTPWVGVPAGVTVAALLLVWPLSPASSESELGPTAQHGEWLDVFREQLQDSGSTGIYVSADATDAAKLRDAIAPHVQQHGAVTGVIHGAGVLADKLIKILVLYV